MHLSQFDTEKVMQLDTLIYIGRSITEDSKNCKEIIQEPQFARGVFSSGL